MRGGMPFERPADMPVQDLQTAPPAQKLGATPLRVVFARLLTVLGTLGLAGYGVFEMLGIVSFSNMTVLQGVMIVFFAITLLWICVRRGVRDHRLADSAAALAERSRRSPARAPRWSCRSTTKIRRARLRRCTRWPKRWRRSTPRGISRSSIISDSTNADAWISESLAVDQLRRDLRETMPVWYRRRWHNTGRKAGNVEDFVKRWGGRYDYMIVLDADSIMAPQTLVALVQPHAGRSAARHPADRADAASATGACSRASSSSPAACTAA